MSGMTFSPSSLSCLKDAEIPKTLGNYSNTSTPVTESYSPSPASPNGLRPSKKIGSRLQKGGRASKNSAIAKFRFTTLGWTDTHTEALKSIQEHVCETIKLAHRDKHITLRISTDASYYHWAVSVTPVHSTQLT